MEDTPLRVLIVEDTAADAELCKHELARAGLRFSAQLVDTREAFEEALRAHVPDLILSDFSMPVFDGLTALDLTRSISTDIPFVFVSGTIGEDRAVEAMRRGATDYVLKDRINRLVPVIERALRESGERVARRRAQQELEETRSRLDSIVSSLPDVVWSFSLRERRLLYVSPAARAVFQQSEADLYANPAGWMNLVHPEDRERMKRDRRRSLATRRLDSAYRVVLPGGGVRWIHDRGTVIRDAEGRLLRVDGLARDVTELKLQEQRISYLARYDTLTGLPNRALLHDRLEQRVSAARRDRQVFSVMMLDIEHFRHINDTLGRQAGDELLRAFSARLAAVLGETDILAHVGGDYFTIATRSVEDTGDVVRLLEGVLTAVVERPYATGGRDLRIAARAGVVLYPSDGADAESLLRNAEAALKDAKRTGDQYLFYAPQMNARVAEQLKMENDLRRAVLEGEFVLHYQPRVELVGERICGFEALIRWRHPERGLVAPGEFIPVLEATGMILDVGRWALRRAARDHAAWRAAGLNPPRVAVNVSAVQLRRGEFVEEVSAALAETAGFRHIDIEITESVLMEDIEGNIGKLKALQEMGVNVAMDDFGTGYCSLAYLARLPINSLKVDRSFVAPIAHGTGHMAIVSTIISLARALNLKVVAEGVETRKQSDLLRLLRCDEVQGYLYARPEPFERAAERMKE